mmetsp:Transcript_15403/g.13938  ORF Transcript_15403/g.13938 Transcript_15403/m.13938 type:complete len:409 (-) Transcript_15403:998-2224(-)
MKSLYKKLTKSSNNYYMIHYRMLADSLNTVSNNNYIDQLEYYGRKKQTSVTVKSLMETAQGERLDMFNLNKQLLDNINMNEKVLLQVACFLHRELPIRLSSQVIDLEDFNVNIKSSYINTICSWYKSSFTQIRSCPVPINKELEQKFAHMIESIAERHSATLITMAKGAHEIKHKYQCQYNFYDENDIQKRLDSFYFNRIGLNTLIGHYLALRNGPRDNDMIGLISLEACPYDIISQAINAANYMCTRQHGDAPEVTIYGNPEFKFAYFPSHFRYIILELLKNSMRATVETHGIDNMPAIRVIIAEGKEDLIVKVSDEGGGIRRSNMNRIWSYLFTTADPSILENMLIDSNPRDFDTASPLAGLGYGLPIARNYARYFGGDLTVMSMEGYGTDSFIYLPKLSDQTTVF